MKMNQRERILAIVAVVLLVVVLGMVASIGMSSLFGGHSSQVATLETELTKLRRTDNKKQHSLKRLVDYERRSLPTDPNVSRREYHAWLVKTIGESFVNEAAVKVSGDANHLGIYRKLSFTVTGLGSIDEVTRFLHKFYSVETLHRIQSMTVAPKDESKYLKLTFLIEALSVVARPGDEANDRTELNVEPDKSRLRYKDQTVDDYLASVANKNLFGPPNEAPRISSVRDQKLTTRDSLNLTLRVSDDGDSKELSYKPGAKFPEGAKLDVATRKLTWPPQKPGRYSFAVHVTDRGFPPMSDLVEFKVDVEEYQPPPMRPTNVEPPKRGFDHAKFTILTAVLQRTDGTRVVWLDPKTMNQEKPEIVALNEEFSFGSVQGRIREIGIEHMVFESQGKQYRLKIGQSLTDVLD